MEDGTMRIFLNCKNLQDEARLKTDKGKDKYRDPSPFDFAQVRMTTKNCVRMTTKKVLQDDDPKSAASMGWRGSGSLCRGR